MRIFKLLQTAFALLALSVTASAQQTPPSPAQGGAPALLPKGKIAFINTSVFYEQLGEFKVKIDALNRQFEPRVKDLQGKAERINALETTMQTQRSTLTPARFAEMNEQLEQQKRQYQREAEDLQVEGQRMREQSFQPLDKKLTKFAQDYTARRGITLLMDLANALNSNTVVWYDPRLDVTQDFINEYNKANPVPAGGGAPKPAPNKQ
ncbi:MAG: OmpH family outer membrane protein [Blastocatellia bacterium]|nr:OmpH family outer membrane protein [Blastocatellia bacterium]